MTTNSGPDLTCDLGNCRDVTGVTSLDHLNGQILMATAHFETIERFGSEGCIVDKQHTRRDGFAITKLTQSGLIAWIIVTTQKIGCMFVQWPYRRYSGPTIRSYW